MTHRCNQDLGGLRQSRPLQLFKNHPAVIPGKERMIERSLRVNEEILLFFCAQIERDNPILPCVSLVVFLEENHGTVGGKAPGRAALTDLLRLTTRGCDHKAARE